MNQQNSQSEKQKEHRFDPELLKKGLKCDLDQYEMLKRCSDKRDITEWNQQRAKYPKEEIWLEGVNLEGFFLDKINLAKITITNAKGDIIENYEGEIHLRYANFNKSELNYSMFANAFLENSTFVFANAKHSDFSFAHLNNAGLNVAYFNDTNFTGAILIEADFTSSNLNGVKFLNSDLKGCFMRACVVDGSTRFWNCHINRYSKRERFTDLTGTALNNVIITPQEKQLFEYNVRRNNWEDLYKKGPLYRKIRKRLTVQPFWLITDYGLATWRIIGCFFGLAFVFALLYRLFPSFVMVYGNVGDIRGFWHALYFSVVTMTTLGFGDIAANPDSWAGQTLLMIQVILGYVLLGALVTRFAVLFTAGGPAGKFADEKGEKDGRQ